MSKKTIKQRIAVVAVSALTAGLFSVVSAPVASAGVPAASVLFLGALNASTTGSAVNADNDQDNIQSRGWVALTGAVTSTVAGKGYTLSGSAASTGTVLPGAQLAFAASNAAAADSDIGFVVTGGTIGTFRLTGTGGDLIISGSATTAVLVGDGDATAEQAGGIFTVSSSAAAGSTVTLSAYVGTGIAGTSTATNGVLVGSWTLTVVSASAVGDYNAANSSVFVQPAIAQGGTSSSANTFDTSTNFDNGSVSVIHVVTRDAYLGAVTGNLTARTDQGAVALAGAASGATVAATDSFSGTTTFAQASFDGNGYVVVRQPTANTASTSVLTISLDGAVIATKTLKWNGIASAISLVAASSSSIFRNGVTVDAGGGTPASSPVGLLRNIVYQITDAAGNRITVTDAATKLTVSDATGSMVGASLSQTDNTGTVAGANVDYFEQSTSANGVSTMLIPASILLGAGTYQLKYVNAAGTSIKSAVLNATVSTGAATFTAGWDKAQYNTGDIAILTIEAKDSGGRLIADGIALGTNALVTTNSDGLTSVTASCDAANIATTTFSGGKKECKFAVKNTAGSYSFTASIPTSTLQSAVAGTIKIVGDSTAVTNADVLKSIVALIASINKQIQALQKLILARR